MSESSTIDKALLAFLNGLCKRMYFKDTDITDEFLRGEVLGGISEEGGYYLETMSCIIVHESNSILGLFS